MLKPKLLSVKTLKTKKQNVRYRNAKYIGFAFLCSVFILFTVAKCASKPEKAKLFLLKVIF